MNAKTFATASNLAYVIVGVVGIAQSGPLSGLFGLACILLGMGSGLFHYFETAHPEVREPARLADRAGMYAVFSTLAVLGAGITSPWAVIAAWAVLAALLKRLPSFYVVGGFAAIALGGLAFQGAWAEKLVIAGLFGIGLGIRGMGGSSSLSHGLWHLVTAPAILGLYLTLVQVI